MKKFTFLVVAVLLTITCCERSTDETQNQFDPEVFLLTSNGLAYKFSDFELYDSSTHMFYFKTIHEEFENFENETFTFFDNGDTIYSGCFWPNYFSSIPAGPFISSTPSFYGNYVLRIEFWYDNKPDVRNCQDMIDVLQERDLLHAGLAVTISSVDINGMQLSFSFTVTNHDQTDLLILDPDKMGPALFHYYTIGLRIHDLEHNEVFTGNIVSEPPSPWNSWNADWLSELPSGESKQFTVVYTMNSSINPGEYIASFNYPGLSFQVAKDQLFQGTNRIWLGDIRISQLIKADSAGVSVSRIIDMITPEGKILNFAGIHHVY